MSQDRACAKWSRMTIRELFTVHGLGAHVDAFEREEVAVSDLAELRDDDLRTHFGVTGFMDRKRFHAMVASLKEDAGAPATRALDAGATRVDAPRTDNGATRVDTSAAGGGSRSVDAGVTRVDGPPSSWPARIGNYRVIGLVGTGGMGTVLRARHVVEAWAEKQGGDVAIKVIHPHLAANPAFERRFIDEAGLGQRLVHPGLVRVYDVVVDGPLLGTVMGFVTGEALAGRVRTGGLAVDEVARLLAPVAETLDHLHAQGIVHRDVKPANIVVRPDGRPVLLDLGIAKDTREGESHTRTRTAMGTSAWMAPEQADAKHVDGAADRYAFGLMAYALLAGRMPWDEGTSEARILSNKLVGRLEPLGAVRAGLPAHVVAAVMRMLAVMPAERFPTCAAFIDALRRGSQAEAREVQARAAQERAATVPAASAMRPRSSWEEAAREAADRTGLLQATREAREARRQAGVFDVEVPFIGDSVRSMTVLRWLKRDGDIVAAGEALVEVDGGLAVLEVAVPIAGRLEVLAASGVEAVVGTVVGRVYPAKLPTWGQGDVVDALGAEEGESRARRGRASSRLRSRA